MLLLLYAGTITPVGANDGGPPSCACQRTKQHCTRKGGHLPHSLNTIVVDALFPGDGSPVLWPAQLQWCPRQGTVQSVQALPAANPSRGQPWRVLTPGFVNVHTHLEYTGYPLVPPQADMADWLTAVVQLTRGHQEASANRLSAQQRAKLGIQQLLGSGTTTVGEVTLTGASAEALAASGLRAVVYQEVLNPLGQTDRHLQTLRQLEHLAQVCAQTQGRLLPGLAPHSPYNMQAAHWQDLLAEQPHWRVQTHGAESLAEMDWLAGHPDNALYRLHKRFFGVEVSAWPRAGSLLDWLGHHRLLSPGLLLIHALWLSEADWGQMATLGLRVGHCPRSNWFLQRRHLRLPTPTAGAVPYAFPVGLGTDSSLSVPTLDLRHDARLARRLHGWDWQTTLCVATLGGATALGLQAVTGSLVANKQADMLLWHVDPPEPHPSDGSTRDKMAHPNEALNHGAEETLSREEQLLQAIFIGKARLQAVWVAGHRLSNSASCITLT